MEQKVFGVGSLATQTVQGGGGQGSKAQGVDIKSTVGVAAVNTIANVATAFMANAAEAKVSKHVTEIRTKLEALEPTGMGATELKNQRRKLIMEMPVNEKQRRLIDQDPGTQLDKGRVVSRQGDRTITSDAKGNITNITAPSMKAANRQMEQFNMLEGMAPTATKATDAFLSKVINPDTKGAASQRFSGVIVPRALDLSMNLRRIGDTATTTLPDMLNTSEINDRIKTNGLEVNNQYQRLIGGLLHPSISNAYENPNGRPPLDMLKNIVRGMNDDMRTMLRADPDIAKETGIDFEAMFRSGVEAMDSQAENVLTQGEAATQIGAQTQIANKLKIDSEIFNERVMRDLPPDMRFIVGSKTAISAISSLMNLDIAANGDGTQYAIRALGVLGAGTHEYTLDAFKGGITQGNINALVGLSNGLPYMTTASLQRYIGILKTVPDYDDKVLSTAIKNRLGSFLVEAESTLKAGNNVGDALTKEQTGAKK